MVAKFVCLFGGVVVVVVVFFVLVFGVFAFDFDGGYGISDCGVKLGEYPVGWGLSADLAIIRTEYGSSLVSSACDYFLKILSGDFLGVDCLVGSLYEQLGDSETGEHLG